MAPPPVVKKPATYADLIRVPDGKVAEILDGELYVSPRPAPRHSHAASALIMELGPPFHSGRRGPGGWWILYEPELHLRNDIVVPDVAGWRRERMPILPDASAFTLPPDWVCEVISPSTEAIDRGKKLAIYAREGVAHAWLINPSSETLEILALANGVWTFVATHAGRTAVRAQPFDAIELDVAALWPPA